MELSKIIDETRNIGDTWEDLDDAGRKTILDYWVYDVLIVVEPIPGMEQAERFRVGERLAQYRDSVLAGLL